MKANELRIGNYVQNNRGTIHRIAKIDGEENPPVIRAWQVKISAYGTTEPEPIPLTEEWLLKFKGQRDESNDVYLPLPRGIDMRLYLKYDHVLLCKGQTCPLFEYEHITNVHQLQNLYFALTGEELEIK